MVFASIIGLLVLAAGVAVISMIATMGVHDALRRFHHGILELDTAFAHVFGARTHEERSRHGSTSFFLVAWAAVIAFFILRIMPWFQNATQNNAVLEASLFGFGLYVTLMLVFLPIFKLGFFGREYDSLVPYWGAFFVAVFVVVASVLLALVL